MLRRWQVTSKGTLIVRWLYILLLWVAIARLLDLLQLGIVRGSSSLATIYAISARLLLLFALYCRMRKGSVATSPRHLNRVRVGS